VDLKQARTKLEQQRALVREAQQAKAEIDRLAKLEALAAELPDRLAQLDCLEDEVKQLEDEAAAAHQAALQETSERARAILETAASETAAWRADLVALCAGSFEIRDRGEVREFFLQLDKHIESIAAIHKPVLDVMAELRALVGADFGRFWAEAGGNDARLGLRFKPGELKAHQKKIRLAIQDLARHGLVYTPGPSR